MEDLQAVQHGYVLAICNDEDTTMFIQTLILADCELSVKYMIIDIEKLIELNSQNVDQLHRITIALSILEKYTRHLLKPEENRSNMWKYVKFSNQIFKDRVDAIQGGRDLMRMMGYKKDIKDGLAFPDDEKTDPDVLTKMLADILLGKQELNLYLTGSHPHSDYIDKLIPQTTIIELKRFQAKLQQIDPASIPSVNQQPAKQESYNPESQARPVATSYTSPAASPSYHQTSEPVQIPPSQTSPRPVSQSQYTYVPQQPSGMPSTTGKAQQLHHAQPSLGQIDSNQIPLVAKLLAQGKSISSEDIDRTPSTSTSTSKPTTISSEESPIISTETGVPQVQAPQPTPVPQYNSDSMGQTSTEESVFPSGSACDICGNRQAEIICEICDNKQLCQDCDDKWHQHPRRQNHKRQNMPGCIEDQHPVDHRSRLPSHGDSVNTAESHAGQDPKSVLNMSHGGGDDIYVTAHYNPPRPGSAEKQPAMGYITNQMQNLQMEAYGRPRTASGDSGTMEGSPAAEPYSVQTGNWFGQQQFPQSYSHQTNVVRPVQSAGPMSSSTGMSSGSPQFYGNQQGSLGSQQYIGNQHLPRNYQYQVSVSQHLQQQNMSGTAPGGPPTSRLLPGILAIPDLHRRKAKLEINLMTLREEIEDVETKINELIAQNAHFFSDPEYASLYKRKGFLTREKMELERYERNLDQAIREEEQCSMTSRKGSSPDVLSQPVIYPPPYVSGAHNHSSSQPQVINPSGSYLVYQYVPTITQGGSLSPETYSLIPATPLFAQQPTLNYQQPFSPQRRTPEFQGMYQSPPSLHNFSNQPQAAIARTRHPNIQQTPVHQAFEGKVDNVPQVSNIRSQLKQRETLQIEEKQNQQNNLKASPPIPHANAPGDKPHSYVNLPKLPTAYPVGEKQTEATGRSTGVRTWICSHCTFHNNSLTNICSVCSKTSPKPQFVDDPQSPPEWINKPDKKDSFVEDDENETAVLAVGKHIGEVHDQIYMEKIAAQKQFQEREREKKQQAVMKPGLPKPKLPDPPVPNPTPRVKTEVKQTTESSPKMINCPKEPVSGGTSESPFSGERFSGPHSSKNFANTLEDIQRKKKQEEMTYEGKKLLMLMKSFEKDGIDADEVELAVELSGTTPVDKWLKEKWMPLVDRVIHMATNQGTQLEQNDVGELSVVESKEALKQNDCDVSKAARLCVEKRRKLYREIRAYGNFAREEILQAMLHSQGRLESAVDELNSKWLQLFHDRLWKTDDNVQKTDEDQMMEDQQRARDNAIAKAASDICNSVTNSVLSYATFQTVVKDRNVDLERRIRLILVEGKLQSWGRAEIVIRILDEEVAKGKLDASLEEVVEAVRNCGDRASSLVFLKQYCEICYSQFPMTKIRNLGCSCKICVGCVKENFEITIREKHVRNMSCPMCSQPNMENVDAASDYLSFLTMLLQTMVSQEIMELYHSKLRDWHLQKDPNFRWCVHCGNGFIWAAGNQNLKMVCPTCKKGTCFSCKKMWEDQHDGLTCEQFGQWKMDNDPENQTAGLARYLEDNGIDCPSCKMKYSLAKGGCMHFKCPQCGYEFCSGCSQPFYQKGVCRKYNSCLNKGLHCHHPRNCLYYLRDEDFDDLQKLLKTHKIQFNTTTSDQEAGQTCPVMEQKEDPEGKRDEACGRDVQEGFAGLCPIHYKEYLVSLINKKKVDPLAIMSVDAMKRLIEREEKKIPERKTGETDAKYRKRLEQCIRDIEPLIRQE